MADFLMKDSESDYSDSDQELQIAFEKKLLKPGLNEVIENVNKQFINNVSKIKTIMKSIKVKSPWIETLDLINVPAPMAPDIALQMQETSQRQQNIRNNNAKLPTINIQDDPVVDEFKRETLFYRQAQTAVMDGISRLKGLGIATKRPDDYFAEMAKSDDHMQKVRQNLLAKQAGQARAEKVRQLRQHKKLGKQVQVEAKLKQQADKRQLLEQIKRIRKGKSNNFDFLEDDKKSTNKFTKKGKKDNFKGKNRMNKGRSNDRDFSDDKKNFRKGGIKENMKRKMKNSKFGFGGKKRGRKTNTRDSSAMVANRKRKTQKNR